MRLARIVAVASSVPLALTTQATGAGRIASEPLGVHAASLTQDGRQLVWRIVLDHPFSPTGLQRDGRSLCLLIERRASGSVAGELCMKPPRHHRRVPQLVYSPVSSRGPGPARAIAANVARTSTRELAATFLPSSVGIGYRPVRWQVISTLQPPACVPSPSDRSGCFLVFPIRPTLAELHVPRLVGCIPSGPPFVASGPRSRHVIALTFDDGPWPDTPAFLHVLERDDVHATFFQIAEQVGTYGQSVDRRMLADGDMIGDHTWNHADVSGDGSFAAGEIARAAAAIRRTTGFSPCLFRAPGGGVSSALISEARSMRFTTIQWDVDPRDWARPGAEAIYSNVVGNAHNGAIVLQHDGGGDRSETLAALPREIDTLRREGYQFVTITELLGQQLLYK